MRLKTKAFLLPLAFMLLALQLSGCAGSRAYSRGQEFYAKGDYDKSVLNYMEAVDQTPERQEYRLRLSEALNKAAWQHLEEGRRMLKERRPAEAATEYRRALEYDKTLVIAENELAKAEKLLKVDSFVQQADDFIRNRRLPQAKNSLDQALLIDPENAAALALLETIKSAPKTIIDGVELDVTSTKPISLKFKNTDIKDAFNILSKLSGVNFILDESLKKQSFTFDITEVSFPQALELILQMNKLGKKILNSRTIVIYSRSKDGDKQFTDHLIQTFYLSNIDAKKAVNLLRTMLQLRKVYVHEELNAIIIRDTADVIKLAGQLLEAADRADAEVTFDLELIEVNNSSAMKLGPLLSPASIKLGLGKEGEVVTSTTGTALTTTSGQVIVDAGLESGKSTSNLVTGGINGLSNLKSFYSLPTLTFDFLKTRTDAEVLANPKIRVKNKEKAKILIGSKEPVITVTANGTVFTDSVAYVDVGVKLDVEPTVQLDNSVVTKVGLEVSSVSSRQKTNNGTQVLTLTTTNAQTVLTLQDGERTIIGGLVRDDTSKSRSGIVLLSDLPIIGALFTNHDNAKSKREILLSITPHIVQNIVVPAAGVGTLWSGGEDDLKSGPVFGAFTSYEDEVVPPTDLSPPVEKSKAGADLLLPPVVIPPQGAPVEAPPVLLPQAEGAPVVIPPPAPAPVPVPALIPEAGITSPPVGTEAVTPTAAELVQLPTFEIPPAGDGSLLLLGPGQVSIGDEIKVAISGKGLNGLFSAPLFVTFDQNLFDLLNVVEGDFLKREGKATVFSTNPVPGKGELMVGYKQGVGGSGVSGEGTLFTATFRAKAPGTAQFSVDRLNLRNAAGQRLKVEATPLAVEVK
jgi:general secretion pathway protein D